MNPYDIDSRDRKNNAVRVVIDTPAGSRNKYKLDESTGLFRISRVLPLGMSFPHDFGSIPSTRAEDGDPLDVMVLGVAPTFPGCLIDVRLLGILQSVQIEHGQRVRNDRLIGVAVTPVNRPEIRELASLDPEELNAVQEFFVSYNRAHGREFKVTQIGDSRAAHRTLEQAEDLYRKSRKS